MSLKDLINDTTEEEKNNNTQDVEGLFNFSRVKTRKEKLHNEELCPHCGTSDTDQFKYYNRCNSDTCEAITYRTPETMFK